MKTSKEKLIDMEMRDYALFQLIAPNSSYETFEWCKNTYLKKLDLFNGCISKAFNFMTELAAL